MTTGRYLLLDRVGVGGMAEVFRAKALGTDGFERVVAIKRIRPHLAADPQFLQMFVDEAKIAGQLRHENIVRIHELGVLDGTHFIAMDYVFGKDLLQLLSTLRRRQQVMAPPMAAWIAASMLAGLHHAHTSRDPAGNPLSLVHRDISPQNVLLSYDGAVKLIDFGIAKATSRIYQTMGDTVKGKAGYMSPQQIAGDPIDHRSDVFAASTCLHEMLTCRRLFRAQSDREVIDRVLHAKADPPSAVNPSVPPELDAIVMKGLARRVEDRWQSAAAMRDALMSYLSRTVPPFGTPQLAQVMTSIFEAEAEAEWEQLKRLARVEEPGVRVAARPAAEHGFEGEDTVVDPRLSAEPGEISRLVRVEQIFGPSLVAKLEEDDPEPFPLVSRPIPAAHPLPAVLLPGSTQGFVVPPGTFDLSDTSEDFERPFHGAVRLAGEPAPRILAPGDSIPDLPIQIAPPPPKAVAAAKPAKKAARAQGGGTPWVLLTVTALLALLLGAGGVLVALFATGVLPG